MCLGRFTATRLATRNKMPKDWQLYRKKKSQGQMFMRIEDPWGSTDIWGNELDVPHMLFSCVKMGY